MALITSCLAIKPGHRAGWARFNEHGTFKNSGVIDGSNATSPAQIIEKSNPTMIVILDWTIPKRANKGTKLVAYRTNLWQAIGEAMGRPTLLVPMKALVEWANEHLEGEPIPDLSKATTLEIAEATMPKAIQVAEAAGLDEHFTNQIQGAEAVAILIGAWAIAYTQTQINRARIAQGVTK